MTQYDRLIQSYEQLQKRVEELSREGMRYYQGLSDSTRLLAQKEQTIDRLQMALKAIRKGIPFEQAIQHLRPIDME